MSYIGSRVVLGVLIVLAGCGRGETGPLRVILDHDGAFEANYAILALTLAAQKDSPPITLIGITTSAVGEGYCNGSNGYPDRKASLLGAFSPDEGTASGITQKVLTIAGSTVPIYSGCGEATAVTQVKDEYSTGSFVEGSGPAIDSAIELPMFGRAGAEPCRLHQEFSILQPDLVCWAEFNRTFRDETLKYVLPSAAAVIKTFRQAESSLIQAKKASIFLAESMCDAHVTKRPLSIIVVGPITNLGRAYDLITSNPQAYGCPAGTALAQLDDFVDVRAMGGAWETNLAANFDSAGNYRLNEPSPVWTHGDIYFQNGASVFAMHHLPAHTPEFSAIQTNHHKNLFNSLNFAEFNFWIDPYALHKVLSSGISLQIVPLNVTNFAKTAGFAQRIKDSPVACNTPAAQFIKQVQLSNMPAPNSYVYDTLSFWDTLTAVSLFVPGLLEMEPYRDLEVTYSDQSKNFNGDPATLTAALNDPATLFRRDQGHLFRLGRTDNPVEMSLKVIDETTFQKRVQDYLFDLICTQH